MARVDSGGHRNRGHRSACEYHQRGCRWSPVSVCLSGL